jgi:hypothetical protein
LLTIDGFALNRLFDFVHRARFVATSSDDESAEVVEGENDEEVSENEQNIPDDEDGFVSTSGEVKK